MVLKFLGFLKASDYGPKMWVRFRKRLRSSVGPWFVTRIFVLHSQETSVSERPCDQDDNSGRARVLHYPRFCGIDLVYRKFRLVAHNIKTHPPSSFWALQLLFQIVPKISLAQVLGEHATFALSIDGVITSSVFYKLLVRRKKEVITTVTPLS